MTKETALSICVIISGIASIASTIFGLPGQGILASCFGAFIGIRIGVYLLGRFEYNFEARYKELYYVTNSELNSFGLAIMFNPKTSTFDLVDWLIPTPRKEDVLSTAESYIPNFVTKLSDFKEIVYGVVAGIGTEALIKQNDSNELYRLHMLTLMQDQAVHDCAGVWLRREGRQNLRISIDNIMHVHMEWTDVESDKETNEHADKTANS